MDFWPRLELEDRGALHGCSVGESQSVPNGSLLQFVWRSPRGVGGEAEAAQSDDEHDIHHAHDEGDRGNKEQLELDKARR